MSDPWAKLQAAHPHLFIQPECAAGWYELLDDLMNNIEKVLAWLPPERWPQVSQIKEKFGGLRFYFEQSALDMSTIEQLIEQATTNSFQTCEICGQPGTLRRNRPWVRTLCDKCRYH